MRHVLRKALRSTPVRLLSEASALQLFIFACRGVRSGGAMRSPPSRARPPSPRRSAETLLEATYQAVLAPGIALRPNVQYVAHPGGGLANPRDHDGKRVRGATVLGLRAITRY